MLEGVRSFEKSTVGLVLMMVELVSDLAVDAEGAQGGAAAILAAVAVDAVPIMRVIIINQLLN